MTPVDDLEVGMWVAVVAVDEEPEPPVDPFAMLMFPGQPRRRERQYDGRPMRILAISLPFVCVSCDGKPCALDLRKYRLQRLSDEYCMAMGTREAKLQRGVCPECGEELTARGMFDYVISQGGPTFCKKCNKSYASSIGEAPQEDAGGQG